LRVWKRFLAAYLAYQCWIAVPRTKFLDTARAVTRKAIDTLRLGPARLNFGDCASYALARFSGEPLLFVGDDFRQTDVAAVSYV
jgi:ribonuclease VapC